MNRKFSIEFWVHELKTNFSQKLTFCLGNWILKRKFYFWLKSWHSFENRLFASHLNFVSKKWLLIQKFCFSTRKLTRSLSSSNFQNWDKKSWKNQKFERCQNFPYNNRRYNWRVVLNSARWKRNKGFSILEFGSIQETN